MSAIRTVDAGSLERAAGVVRSGGLIVLPTETVYGVACDPTNERAIAHIFAIKHRAQSKPLQVLLPSTGELGPLGLTLPAPLDRLAAKFLPGAFSPIAVASGRSKLKTIHEDGDGKRTQAIRVPGSAVCLRILAATGPLAATSANQSGDESAQTVEQAYQALGDEVDLYLDGGPTQGSVASTVVAADQTATWGVSILRDGVIPAGEILDAVTATSPGGEGAVAKA